MTFQEKLVILRKSKGLTQDEFASAVGVSRQAVYKWESGQSYPEVPKLLEMKILFSISIDELLDDTYDIPLPEKKKRKRANKSDAPKAEKEVKTVTKPATKPAAKPAPAKAEPAPAKAEPAPVAPKVAPAPAVQPAPVAPKVAPAPAVQPAPVAPKVEPAPAVQPAPVAPKVAPAPAVQPAPVAPKVEPAPVKAEPVAPKVEPTPVKAEPVIDTVPSPIVLEDIVAEEPKKTEPEKKGFFGRFFGKK